MNFGARLCPICRANDPRSLGTYQAQSYFHCLNCQFVWVPREQHLSHSEEKAIYDLHQNNPEDIGYRAFLSQLITPLLERLKGKACHGLDFGCGPGPTLSLMLEEAGHQVALYDPYYFAAPQVFDHDYDFITLTEVAEHLADPLPSFQRLTKCLRAGGVLAVMTRFLPDHLEDFAGWTYKNDPTHISFYHADTFALLAHELELVLDFPGKNLAFFTKN